MPGLVPDLLVGKAERFHIVGHPVEAADHMEVAGRSHFVRPEERRLVVEDIDLLEGPRLRETSVTGC